MAQLTQFWKNMSMKGGLILLFITAGGRYSVDYFLQPKGEAEKSQDQM